MPEGLISPWKGETDPIKRLVLGKMAEELSECAARVARCQIAGINDIDPDSGLTNLDELEKEMADVYATFRLAKLMINLRIDVDRINKKLTGFNKWMNMVQDE